MSNLLVLTVKHDWNACDWIDSIYFAGINGVLGLVHIFVMLKTPTGKCVRISFLPNGPSRLKFRDSNFTLAADGEARERAREKRGSGKREGSTEERGGHKAERGRKRKEGKEEVKQEREQGKRGKGSREAGREEDDIKQRELVCHVGRGLTRKEKRGRKRGEAGQKGEHRETERREEKEGNEIHLPCCHGRSRGRRT